MKQILQAHAGNEYAASRGEFLNGKVMAAYLGYEFIDAAEVIRFDKNGNFDADKTDKLLAKTTCRNAKEQLFQDFTVAWKMEQLRLFPEVVLM